MTGFYGQKFDFTGHNGAWYAVLSDPRSMHVNMRVTSPMPSLQQITYITGISLLTKDDEGVEHTVVIAVKEPNSLDSACPKNVYPCLADGALEVVIDGNEELISPGEVSVGPGVQVTAVNIPGECRSFGFEKYWERKKEEYAMAGRRLSNTLSIGEWVLADPTATNMVECATYVADAMASEGGMFTHQSEHVSFQIVTPAGNIRLSHGRLHQLPMRDPTDRFDLPDHTTWQMNMAVDSNDVGLGATGVLGETMVPTLDDNGMPIMHGMGAIRGSQEDCEWVKCPVASVVYVAQTLDCPNDGGYGDACRSAHAWFSDTPSVLVLLTWPTRRRCPWTRAASVSSLRLWSGTLLVYRRRVSHPLDYC